MASAFGHAASAFGLGKLFPQKIIPAKVYVLGIISAILPDIDVIAYKFGIGQYGESIWGHRGFTHSFFAALLWMIILLLVFHRKEVNKLIIGSYYFLTTASHGLLDAMTTGGDGIAFFAPFSSERLFLPFRVIQVSPLGIKNFFSEWGIEVLKSEMLWIGMPCLAMIGLGHFLNKSIYR